MFKNFSIQVLLENTKDTFLRFPLTLIAAIIATVAGMLLVDASGDESDFYLKLGMCSVLGIAGFLSIKLYTERYQSPKNLRFILQIALALLLTVYFFLLPKDLSSNTSEGLRYTLWLIGIHLFVAFVPYVFRVQEYNGFWQYNQELFLRIIAGGIYSGVLYSGVSIAIVAIDQLFGAEIDPIIYARLWFFIAGIFNTWFFLAGVPKNIEALNQSDLYPKGLKLFTQYVLLPLVVLYLLILYAYGIKILITWQLPQGWVSILILAFSIVGILSLLLVYPLREFEENKWINIFANRFYIALLPLILLLFISIGKRIFEYGITELRYFVVILAFWLLGTALYFLISKKKYIQIIPMSLFAVVVFSSFGPWGAFYVSERSQIGRLENILNKYERIKEGKIIPFEESQEISEEDAENIVSILDYLAERRRLKKLQSYFDEDLDSLYKNEVSYTRRNKTLALFANEEMLVNTGNSINFDAIETHYFSVDADEYRANEVKGYDYSLSMNIYKDSEKETIMLNNTYKVTLDYRLSKNTIEIFILKNGKAITEKATAVIDLSSMQKNLLKNYKNQNTVPQSKMTVLKENKYCKIKLENSSINFHEKSNGKTNYNNLNGTMLIKILEK